MVVPNDPLDRSRGPRAPSAGKPVGQGKGMGVSPTHDSVARPKATVAVVVQGRGVSGGGTGHHDDGGDGGVGRRPGAEAPRSDR
jgi:hypothetical protein